MALVLKFDADRLYADLVEHLMTVMDSINQQFFKEATSGLSAEGKADSDIEKAVLENEPDFMASEGTKFIIARCKFYAEALMDSFGTGSKADTSSDSYWEDYRETANGNPKYFNPLRTGTTVVGRPRGSYIDIYGKQQSTFGNYAGRSIEIKDAPADEKDSSWRFVPKSPSYSIQRAEDWFLREGYSRKIEGKIEEELIRFLQENAKDYFYLG